MKCPKCDTNVDENQTTCPSCGEQLHPQGGPTASAKRRMPLWFKIIALIALIALIAITAGILFTESIVDVVDNQLTSLRENNISNAYYSYTAKDFREATTFDEFQNFIQSYPAFLNNQSANFTKRYIETDHATLKGVMTTKDHQQIPIEYTLVKDDEGKWKILSIRLLPTEETHAASLEAKNPEHMIENIQAQLNEIQRNNLVKAYKNFTSKDFKKETTYKNFQQFVHQNPIFEKHSSFKIGEPNLKEGTATITVEFKDALGKPIDIHYISVFEDYGWKIWSIRIIEPTKN